MTKPSGFTLVLDGSPDEVAEILRVVGDEFVRLERDAWKAFEESVGRLGVGGRPHCSLRGRIEIRHDLSNGFPE